VVVAVGIVAVAVGPWWEEPCRVLVASSLSVNLRFLERERESNCAKREKKLGLGLYLKKIFQNPNLMMMVRLIFFGYSK